MLSVGSLAHAQSDDVHQDQDPLRNLQLWMENGQVVFAERFLSDRMEAIAALAVAQTTEAVILDFVDRENPLDVRATQRNGLPYIELDPALVGLATDIAIIESFTTLGLISTGDGLRLRQTVAQSILVGSDDYREMLDMELNGIVVPDDLSQTLIVLVPLRIVTIVDYVLAHELAHHILGHLNDIGAPNLNNEELRNIETEADIRAAHMLAKMTSFDWNYYALQATATHSLMLISMMVNIDVLAFEALRSHPVELRRMLSFVEVFSSQTTIYFPDNNELQTDLEQARDQSAASLETWYEIKVYQKWVNHPDNPVISFDEWKALQEN